MAIDPNEVNRIEDSMVHDEEDDSSKLSGWELYLTLRFISKVLMGVYGLMLVAMLGLQIALRGGEKMPVSLSPESLLFALPIVLVAVYFYFVADPEPAIEKRRTTAGRVITFLIAFIVMQVVSVGLWILTAKAFSLY